MSNVYPVRSESPSRDVITLDNHLDTLLEAAKGSNKALGRINKAYDGLLMQLIKAAKGDVELTKGQFDAIKIILSEQKHLAKIVGELEELIKKVQKVEGTDQPTPQPTHTPLQDTEQQKENTRLMMAKLKQRKGEGE